PLPFAPNPVQVRQSAEQRSGDRYPHDREHSGCTPTAPARTTDRVREGPVTDPAAQQPKRQMPPVHQLPTRMRQERFPVGRFDVDDPHTWISMSRSEPSPRLPMSIGLTRSPPRSMIRLNSRLTASASCLPSTSRSRMIACSSCTSTTDVASFSVWTLANGFCASSGRTAINVSCRLSATELLFCSATSTYLVLVARAFFNMPIACVLRVPAIAADKRERAFRNSGGTGLFTADSFLDGWATRPKGP